MLAVAMKTEQRLPGYFTLHNNMRGLNQTLQHTLTYVTLQTHYKTHIHTNIPYYYRLKSVLIIMIIINLRYYYFDGTMGGIEVTKSGQR